MFICYFFSALLLAVMPTYVHHTPQNPGHLRICPYTTYTLCTNRLQSAPPVPGAAIVHPLTLGGKRNFFIITVHTPKVNICNYGILQ